MTTLKKSEHVILSFASCASCTKCLSGHPNRCNSFVPLNLLGTKTTESHQTVLERTTSEQSTSTDLTTFFFGQSSLSSYANVNQRSCVPFDPALLQRPRGTAHSIVSSRTIRLRVHDGSGAPSSTPASRLWDRVLPSTGSERWALLQSLPRLISHVQTTSSLSTSIRTSWRWLPRPVPR